MGCAPEVNNMASPAQLTANVANAQKSSGPKTEQGKHRTHLNAYRHGLTGQICLLTADEQQAFDHHCTGIRESLQPVGALETDLAQSIAEDHWRLKRARAIEASTFALGSHQRASDSAGHPEVDNAFAQVRTWEKAAHNLQLLTIYEQRIRRAVEKNMAQFETLQTKRKAEAAKAMEQAKMLYRLAKAQGKPYRPEAFFTAAPEVRESVFSSAEVARELSRARLLANAQTYHYIDKLPEENHPEQPVEAAAA